MLGVADGYVSGKTVVESVEGEGATGGDEAFLAVLPLFGERSEGWDRGENAALLSGLVDGLTSFDSGHLALG